MDMIKLTETPPSKRNMFSTLAKMQGIAITSVLQAKKWYYRGQCGCEKVWSSASVQFTSNKLVFAVRDGLKDISIDVDAIVTERFLMKHRTLYGVVLGLYRILNISILLFLLYIFIGGSGTFSTILKSKRTDFI
jgi:hypothetical protein